MYIIFKKASKTKPAATPLLRIFSEFNWFVPQDEYEPIKTSARW